jgi:8-amino-7-oxononanoate synthase
MKVIEDQMNDKLQARSVNMSKRKLIDNSLLKDFTSNDYLSLARTPKVQSKIDELTKGLVTFGSTGSRLLTGNHKRAHSLEIFLSNFHKSEDALLFNSGFDLNFGLFSAIAQSEHDFFIYDELIHSSMIEGIKRSKTKKSVQFQHNSITEFERKLKDLIKSSNMESNVFVCVESVYSMDGSICRLNEIYDIAKQYQNVHLIIDEAHGTGILGPTGRGLVSFLGLEDKILARIHTFGKAIGCHGAVVLGSSILCEYLVNYAKPLIFSTFMPLHSIITIECCYEYMMNNHNVLIGRLNALIRRFKTNLKSLPDGILLESDTPIQGIIVKGNDNVCRAADILQKRFGLDIRPIRFPTVAKGTERLRICLHSHNTLDDVDYLCTSLGSIFLVGVSSKF